MSTLRNSVKLIGHVGTEPEIVNLDSGKKLAKFSIATNEYYKNAKGEKVSETQWHNLVAWGKTADLVENYVPKGKEIAIDGKLTSRSYEDKTGTKRYITEIICNEILLLGK
ncbi:single-stranded DNA-binding protein [Zunongwangia profunda]|jgi:single-strand DNA-binding protein|uniref:single-stranded DNA-binding protein n=1 Tax=Zunongwangia profunda TaxID=398743 RepID=UPI001D184F59|nr:single-stranded DNA-binding protein [Zunongwangia profunda]MCC4226622.1 single-stranded DNA-binding protein [Zunongwangia profunda]|tara:strand:+ start:1771 stop:2103 length:333 start_codon:yes stop_codon:yes gene_type:complete